MFEQAVLTRQRRPWTLTLSFTMQSAFVAAAVLISIWHVERLPAFEVPGPPVQSPRRPRPVDVVAVERSVRGTSTGRTTFQAKPVIEPSRIPDRVAMVVDGMPQAEPSGVSPGPMPADFGDVYRWERPLTLPPPPPPEAVQRAESAAPPKRIRLGGVVLASKLVKRVMPEYPRLAVNMRLSGTVKLLATVGIDGRVRELQLLEGHPLLVPAAMAAVRQWLYTPTLLNAEPVEVNAPIEVHFTLQH